MQECWQSRNCMMIYKTLHLTPLVEQCVHGDPANPLRVHLQAPFRVGILTRDMEMFNESVNTVRSSVEWLFGDIVNYFYILQKNWKIGLSQVGKMYIVCSILRNGLTCLYSNTTVVLFLD